jgi:hypothetical protein
VGEIIRKTLNVKLWASTRTPELRHERKSDINISSKDRETLMLGEWG